MGKTTLVNQILSGLNYRVRLINADELFFRDVLSSQDARQLRDLVEGYDVLFVAEAQRVTNIGINPKIIADTPGAVRPLTFFERIVTISAAHLTLTKGGAERPMASMNMPIRIRPSGDAAFALPYCAYRPSLVMR